MDNNSIDLINLSTRTMEKDIMFSREKQIVLTSQLNSTSTRITTNELVQLIKDKMHQPADNAKKDTTNYWIDLQSLSESDISDVCDLLGIHALTKKDIIKQETREKCEFFSNHIFVVVNEIHYEEGSNNLVSDSLNILLFDRFVFTFHSASLISTSQVMRMLKYSMTGTLPSAAWVIYAYLDGIVDLYIDLVDKIMMETQSLDELVLVLSGMKQDELFTRIGLAGRRVTNLHSGVFGKRDEKLIPQSLLRYLRNVQDHVVRMLQKLTLSQRLLGNLNNIYMARVSLEVSDASNSVNRSMRKFTAVSTIFVPLTFLAGIFGMNVKLPGMDVDNYYSFIAIMLFMLLFGITVAFLFKRSGWL
ncbi:putative CorA family magnesium ion transporter [Cavenderia fasciculata]|uniref:CorA family magnesium ion transporter n=1 Tax=Cavenderia fasciculata TaxID=261658 RepID=F4PT58_CACFS|nr:putative CorA family magnesium ion transporter [Cavenderia fasciculata]EGG20794.1 putative CorA family magnesium ion transporter [Cavenderia fasciculata]|eukprot:XP_004358644.1 putative CorA family magnesium ion transporter [Cavenderia fasciculata]